VTREGLPVTLTAREFAVLRYLMPNSRRVVSKPQILDRVWDYDFGRVQHRGALHLDQARVTVMHSVRPERTDFVRTRLEVDGFEDVPRPSQRADQRLRPGVDLLAQVRNI